MKAFARLVVLGAIAALALCAWAEELLVLKDGRKIAVTRLIRKDGNVVFQTTKNETFSVPEDQVVSPPLERIPTQTLVLKDGRHIPVLRLARRAGSVVFQTLKGEGFSVPEDQVVEPPLETITQLDAAPAPISTQTLVLKDGRRIPVLRLARRGGNVIFQTAKGEGFSVPEDQVVEPPLETIAQLDAAPAPAPPVVPVPEATPEPAPAIEAPTLPPAPALAAPAIEGEFVPMSDRWSIPYPESPRIVKGRLIDPYNQNVLKGDRPVIGNSTFLVLTGTLETPFETKRVPVASGVSALDPGSAEFFGRGGVLFTSPRALVSMELFQGQTAFKPKSWSLKATGAFNLNYVRFNETNNVDVDVREDKTRRRQDFALEEAFAEVKLKTLTPHYDFLSLRAGIQPFVSDFRGFIFSDQNLGARLFGNAANNTWQYNAAYFDLLEKGTNSELNTFARRDQKVMIANLFKQDFLTHGYTLSASYHRSQDEASKQQHYDENGFLVRPAKIGSPRLHDIEANYVGIAGDGHWGRLNVSKAFYYVFGRDEDHPLGNGPQDVSAFMGAIELSVDRDWARFKLAGFFASGDNDPRDGKARGFDSVYDAPNFAGGIFSFWNRTPIGLTQTGVLLKGPSSLLPDLRSNKFEGQANFVNPGIMIANAEIDAELTPKLKAVLTGSYLRFDKTGALALLLFQPEIRKPIGIDLGGGFVYRPLLNENIVFTAGLSGLLPGKGFDDIYSSPCGTPGCGAKSRDLFNGFVQLKLTY